MRALGRRGFRLRPKLSASADHGKGFVGQARRAAVVDELLTVNGLSGLADGPVLGRWAAPVPEVWAVLATAQSASETASVLRESAE